MVRLVGNTGHFDLMRSDRSKQRPSTMAKALRTLMTFPFEILDTSNAMPSRVELDCPRVDGHDRQIPRDQLSMFQCFYSYATPDP